MRILFIAHYSGYYGANKSLVSLMTWLKEKKGVEPVVLLPSEGPVCEELSHRNIDFRVHHYYWWINYNTGIFQWFLNKRKQLRNLREINDICALFKDTGIDLVYSNSVTVNIGAFIADKMDVPHIWQFRESISQYKLSLSTWLSKLIWRKPCTKKYILISDYMMEYYSRFLPKDRMVRIYNGIDIPDSFQPASKSKEGDDTINLCEVGVICRQKNQEDAIRALRILKDQGISVTLHFFGVAENGYLAYIKQLADTLGVADEILFHGHEDNIYEAISGMDIGLMTSVDEAFGRTTIEYMQCGMPVIASASGANPELIKNGENGYLYRLGNPEDLASKIGGMIEKKDEIERLGKQAHEFAKQFSVEKNADLIYQQICQTISK